MRLAVLEAASKLELIRLVTKRHVLPRELATDGQREGDEHTLPHVLHLLLKEATRDDITFATPNPLVATVLHLLSSAPLRQKPINDQRKTSIHSRLLRDKDGAFVSKGLVQIVQHTHRWNKAYYLMRHISNTGVDRVAWLYNQYIEFTLASSWHSSTEFQRKLDASSANNNLLCCGPLVHRHKTPANKTESSSDDDSIDLLEPIIDSCSPTAQQPTAQQSPQQPTAQQSPRSKAHDGKVTSPRRSALPSSRSTPQMATAAAEASSTAAVRHRGRGGTNPPKYGAAADDMPSGRYIVKCFAGACDHVLLRMQLQMYSALVLLDLWSIAWLPYSFWRPVDFNAVRRRAKRRRKSSTATATTKRSHGELTDEAKQQQLYEKNENEDSATTHRTSKKAAKNVGAASSGGTGTLPVTNNTLLQSHTLQPQRLANKGVKRHSSVDYSKRRSTDRQSLQSTMGVAMRSLQGSCPDFVPVLERLAALQRVPSGGLLLRLGLMHLLRGQFKLGLICLNKCSNIVTGGDAFARAAVWRAAIQRSRSVNAAPVAHHIEVRAAGSVHRPVADNCTAAAPPAEGIATDWTASEFRAYLAADEYVAGLEEGAAEFILLLRTKIYINELQNTTEAVDILEKHIRKLEVQGSALQSSTDCNWLARLRGALGTALLIKARDCTHIESSVAYLEAATENLQKATDLDGLAWQDVYRCSIALSSLSAHRVTANNLAPQDGLQLNTSHNKYVAAYQCISTALQLARRALSLQPGHLGICMHLALLTSVPLASSSESDLIARCTPFSSTSGSEVAILNALHILDILINEECGGVRCTSLKVIQLFLRAQLCPAYSEQFTWERNHRTVESRDFEDSVEVAPYSMNVMLNVRRKSAGRVRHIVQQQSTWLVNSLIMMGVATPHCPLDYERRKRRTRSSSWLYWRLKHARSSTQHDLTTSRRSVSSPPDALLLATDERRTNRSTASPRAAAGRSAKTTGIEQDLHKASSVNAKRRGGGPMSLLEVGESDDDLSWLTTDVQNDSDDSSGDVSSMDEDNSKTLNKDPDAVGIVNDNNTTGTDKSSRVKSTAAAKGKSSGHGRGSSSHSKYASKAPKHSRSTGGRVSASRRKEASSAAPGAYGSVAKASGVGEHSRRVSLTGGMAKQIRSKLHLHNSRLWHQSRGASLTAGGSTDLYEHPPPLFGISTTGSGLTLPFKPITSGGAWMSAKPGSLLLSGSGSRRGVATSSAAADSHVSYTGATYSSSNFKAHTSPPTKLQQTSDGNSTTPIGVEGSKRIRHSGPQSLLEETFSAYGILLLAVEMAVKLDQLELGRQALYLAYSCVLAACPTELEFGNTTQRAEWLHYEYARAYLLAAQGDLVAAEICIVELMLKHPYYTRAALLRSRILTGLGKFEEALLFAEQGVSQEHSVASHRNLGKAQMNLKMHDKAAISFARSLDLTAASPAALPFSVVPLYFC